MPLSPRAAQGQKKTACVRYAGEAAENAERIRIRITDQVEFEG